jgi:hypothetical protein
LTGTAQASTLAADFQENEMDLSSLLLFIPACFALNMAPGPNNLLSLHNASRYGLQRHDCPGGDGPGGGAAHQ